MKNKNQLLTLPLLIGICINSTIGIGIFNLPVEFARVSNPIFSVLAFIIAGIGMGAIGLTFKNLSDFKPSLNSGMVSFMKEGFDEYFSTVISFGYFISTIIAFVAFFTLFTKTFDSIINTGFNQGNTFLLFLVASFYLWSIFIIYLGGVKKVGKLSIFITFVKFIPIFSVLAFSLIHFDYNLFNVSNVTEILASTNKNVNVFAQLSKAIIKSIFCFLGIESLLNLIPNAKNKSDIGKGIFISTLIAAILYIITVTLISGNISQQELYSCKTPFAVVLANSGIVYASTIIKFTILFSIMGSIFIWFLNVISFPYVCSLDGIFPKIFLKRNDKDIPVNSMISVTIFMQLLLFLMFKMDLQTLYSFVADLATTFSIMVYLITVIYAFKEFRKNKKTVNMILSVISIIFMLFALYSVGLRSFVLSVITYICALPIFLKTKQEKNEIIDVKIKKEIIAHILITILFIILYYKFL